MTSLMKAQLYAERATHDLQVRDKWIVQSRRQGFSLKRIADAVHLTPQGVAKILRRNLAERLDNSVDERKIAS